MQFHCLKGSDSSFKLSKIFLLYILSIIVVFAQSRVDGRITDKESGEPLVGVNIFFSKTTWGATTDSQGFYSIGNIPYGKDCLDGENLIDNPKENKLIRKMISLRKKNFSYGEITNFLNRNRYKSKSGKKFTRGNVYGILKSRLNYV